MSTEQITTCKLTRRDSEETRRDKVCQVALLTKGERALERLDHWRSLASAELRVWRARLWKCSDRGHWCDRRSERRARVRPRENEWKQSRLTEITEKINLSVQNVKINLIRTKLIIITKLCSVYLHVP